MAYRTGCPPLLGTGTFEFGTGADRASLCGQHREPLSPGAPGPLRETGTPDGGGLRRCFSYGGVWHQGHAAGKAGKDHGGSLLPGRAFGWSPFMPPDAPYPVRHQGATGDILESGCEVATGGHDP